MANEDRQPGWDAKAIHRVAQRHYGSLEALFDHFGWSERGQEMMTAAPRHIVQRWGSIESFVDDHDRRLALAPSIWDRGYSVLFTSFWNWRPESWGALGFTGNQGFARRANLLRELTDPFIAVIYLTDTANTFEESARGKIAGFLSVSHELGDRDQFTDPAHHARDPEKWRHALRPVRAFTYLPEYQVRADALIPDLSRRALSIAKWGEILTDKDLIERLATIPHVEVPIYGGGVTAVREADDPTGSGFVRGGPAAGGDYVVRGGTLDLPRRLYVLELDGDQDGYLGHDSNGQRIVKVGLSASPELRRQGLNKAMPRGTYRWRLLRQAEAVHFYEAEKGEMAMKRHLAAHGKWLDGEFYLASDEAIEAAWRLGRAAAGGSGCTKTPDPVCALSSGSHRWCII